MSKIISRYIDLFNDGNKRFAYLRRHSNKKLGTAQNMEKQGVFLRLSSTTKKG